MLKAKNMTYNTCFGNLLDSPTRKKPLKETKIVARPLVYSEYLQMTKKRDKIKASKSE
jgi:hypothetical protein